MKTIIWILVIWIVGSCIYGWATGQLDMSPFKQQYRIFMDDHPVITVLVTIAIGILLFNLLF